MWPAENGIMKSNLPRGALRTVRLQYEFPFGARISVRSTRTPMVSAA